MGDRIFTRSAAAWADSTYKSVWVRDSGTWKEVKTLKVRDGGVWKVGFEAFIGFLRPNADLETSDWEAAPLYEKLDEVTADDATTEIDSEIFSNPAGADVYDFDVGLEDPAIQPIDTEVITLRVRHWIEILSGGLTSNDVTIELKEGGVVRASLATSGHTGTYTTSTIVLSQAEKDSIINYDDLHVRFEQSAQVDSFGDQSQAHVTWIELGFV